MKNEVAGIDISKLTFDAYLHEKQMHREFSNDSKGFIKFIQWLKKNKLDFDRLLICFEHTGMYSYPISIFLSARSIDYVMESALQIKRSLGLARGKSDRVDAKRIAEYAFLRKDQLELSKAPMKDIQRIEKLLSLRETIVKQRSVYKVLIAENKRILKAKEHKCFFDTQKSLLKKLNGQIDKIELEIRSIIKANEKLKKVYSLVTSVKGVGFVLGTSIITTTACFSKFENGRKYACYCGTAPFEYTSGSSIKNKTKVNHMANKRMKSLFNMAARAAVTHDPELKTYYHRKIEEGKNKMSTLNAVRNKIIHRVFAVVNRGTPYVTLNNYAN